MSVQSISKNKAIIRTPWQIMTLASITSRTFSLQYPDPIK